MARIVDTPSRGRGWPRTPGRKPGRKKRHTHHPGHPPGSGGTEPGGTTTTTASDETGMAGTSGTPDLTSASTTAPVPADNTAQMTDEAEAFFGSGHGPALHYDLREQAVTADGTAQGGG